MDHQMMANDFWDDPQKAREIIGKSNQQKAILHQFESLGSQVEDLRDSIELLEEEEDEELREEAEKASRILEKELRGFELDMLLDEAHDSSNAIVEIHPGAGGTESQDWGEMLLRMYRRWAEQHDFSVEFIDYQNGEEAGLKSATFLVKGHNAYGYLKAEKGVHRLVRISPFDSAGKRHTSFCSVDVVPELSQDVNVDIRPDDLKIDTYRASGAGGQHINKTSSAVRITHLPTGIVTQSQAQRSQFANKETAMQLLKAKLLQMEEEEKAKELASIRGEQLEIGWGSQIRNYVFHPYSLVKDLRTEYATSSISDVMDGDLDGFIDAYLKWRMGKVSDHSL